MINLRMLFTTRYRLILIVAFLLLLKIIIQLYLYHRGFISVSIDESVRGKIAAQWLDGDVSTSIHISDWLPAETYLNGFSLMIWNDAIWTPRITVFVFSILLLIYFVRIVQLLFEKYLVTFLAGLLLVTTPWYTWLSSTPMLEIYYLALFITGLYYFLAWFKTKQDLNLILSGVALFLSTTFDFQSWILINAINICVCYYIFMMIQKREFSILIKFLFFLIFINLFIPFYLIGEYLSSGAWLYNIHEHTNFSKNYYNGYNVGIYKKILYYPTIVSTNLNAIGLLIPIGLYWIGSKKIKIYQLLPFLIGFISLFGFCLFNIYSVPATAVPGRYSLPFIVLFVPYSALGIYAFSKESGYFTDFRSRILFIVILVSFIVGFNIVQIRRFQNPNTKQALNVGLLLKKLLESKGSEKADSVLIEASNGDFLTVELAIRDFKRVHLDRNDIKQSSYLLTTNEIQILQRIRKEHIKYIAVKDKELVSKMDNEPYLHKINSISGWQVYGFVSSPKK